MKPDRLKQLVEAADPFDGIVDDLKSIWSTGRLAECETAGDMDVYIGHGEHEVSAYEESLWRVFHDLYPMLECPHVRQLKVEDVIGEDSFALVIFDALSWRELPIIESVLEERGMSYSVDYVRSEVPSETNDFCSKHFGVNGPTALKNKAASNGWDYEYVENTNWTPDAARGKRRLIWVRYPDMIFALPPAGVNYHEHVVQPVRKILSSILDACSGPLTITGDHGYVWMGGGATWPLDGDEAKLLSQHFKASRCTHDATTDLYGNDKVWVSGDTAAARGRFAWGGNVAGATKLYKHGGVSLMECLIPWLAVG